MARTCEFDLPQRTGGGVNRLPDNVTAHNHFDSAILLTAWSRVVGSDRCLFSQSDRLDIRRTIAVLSKVIANRVGAPLRELQICIRRFQRYPCVPSTFMCSVG